MSKTLTPEQILFLADCEEEFADRYTDKDPEYKEVYDSGIPPPPIICPWTVPRRGSRGGSGGRWQHQSGDSTSHSRDWHDNRKRHRNDDTGYDDYERKRRRY